MLEALLVGGVAFTATNIDDVLILISFMADPHVHARDVVVGQYLGIAALAALSLACALLAAAVPREWLAAAGLLPLAIGAKALWSRWRGDDDDDDAPAVPSSRAALAVAAVTVANGGDNIGVYIPLFALRPLAETGAILAVFAAMTGLWRLAAHWLVNHRRFGGHIQRWGGATMPWVLIGLGLYIVWEQGAFGLVSGGR